MTTYEECAAHTLCRMVAMVVDPGSISLLLVALVTIACGAMFSWDVEVEKKREREQENETERRREEQTVITMPMVALMLVAASCSLLIIYYFGPSLQWFLLAWISYSAFVCLSMVAYLMMQKLSLFQGEDIPDDVCAVSISSMIAVAFGGTVLALWWWTWSWWASNLIAFSLGAVIMREVALPNLKVASLLLWLFLLYDVFWVFLSPYFFHQDKSNDSVMLHVAKQLPDFPLLISWPSLFVHGVHRLGLGDILFPGFVLCFLYRADGHRSFSSRYFGIGCVSYIGSLLCTLMVLAYIESGQPALLYIVPILMGTIYVESSRRGEFMALWRGPFPDIDVNLDMSDIELEPMESP